MSGKDDEEQSEARKLARKNIRLVILLAVFALLVYVGFIYINS